VVRALVAVQPALLIAVPPALLIAVLAATALVAGCRAPWVGSERRLPADRGAVVLYVALGDSTVEGIGASQPEHTYVSRLHGHLRERYPAAEAVNLGVGGATSADVLAAQLPRAIELRPHLVTLSVGPNDITRGVPVGQYERNMASTMDSLADKTTALIIVNLLPDLAVTRRFQGSAQEEAVGRLTRKFNDALRRVAHAHGVEVVDLYTASRQEVPRRPELLAADGYHPSDAGHARWAELMWAEIARRITRGG
jgi:acyl-CoA thioesterase-1